MVDESGRKWEKERNEERRKKKQKKKKNYTKSIDLGTIFTLKVKWKYVTLMCQVLHAIGRVYEWVSRVGIIITLSDGTGNCSRVERTMFHCMGFLSFTSSAFRYAFVSTRMLSLLLSRSLWSRTQQQQKRYENYKWNKRSNNAALCLCSTVFKLKI